MSSPVSPSPTDTTRTRVGIAGVTGYAGYELWRLLQAHPWVQVSALSGGRGAGSTLAQSWPGLEGQTIAAVDALTVDWARDLDVVFLALPHGVSGEYVAQLQQAGLLARQGGKLRVIDLGADFRLKDPAAYAAAYHAPHPCPDLLEVAVYGLPEVFGQEIVTAPIIANPGCYPTATALGARALIAAGCTGPVHTSCVSGISGAGRKAGPRTLYGEVQESVVAYGVGGTHRHVPEMEQLLQRSVIFTPHLVPMIRGMLATVTMEAPESLDSSTLAEITRSLYAGAPAVFVRSEPPATRDVRGTGAGHVFTTVDSERRTAQAFVAIDNLGKGAAAQAVHNLNLMLGFPELTGVPTTPLLP